MARRTYECIPAFGWGIRGPAISGILHELKRLGLENEHTPSMPKFMDLVSPYPVKVTGKPLAVKMMEKYMQMMGYDERLYL